MPELTTIPAAELAELKERLNRLAQEKAQMQLIALLMNRLSELPGLDKTVEGMLQFVMEILGGLNATIFYRLDDALHCVDVYGRKEVVGKIQDDLVQQVFETREFVSRENDFRLTGLMTKEFTKATTWVMPLLVGAELVGVLRIEGLLMAGRELRNEVQTFLRHASLVLKNEISGETRLRRAYDEVSRANRELTDEIAERRRAEAELRRSETKFHGLVSQSLVGIAIVEDGRYSYTNSKFDSIFGYSADEIQHLGPLDITVEDDRALVAEQMRRRLSGEVEGVAYVFRGLRKDGTVVDIQIHGSGMDMGGRVALISLVADVTERTRAEREVRALQARLSEEAIRDPLTDLYNRRYLEETFSRELTRARRCGQPISLILADIDHFKAVNDAYGHPAGDEVLRVFSELLKRSTRGSDIPCRYGGEEFLLILPDSAPESAFERAEQLRLALARELIGCGGSVIQVTASFGVAAFPQHGVTSVEVIAAVDSALYAAKDAGRNQVKSFSGQRESLCKAPCRGPELSA